METRRKIILFLISLLLVLIILFYILFQSMTGFASKVNNPKTNIKTATFAICEQNESYTLCKDKIFASCNGSLIEVKGTSFICENVQYEIENISLGESYKSKSWEDTRQKDFLTSWAISD